MQATAAVRVEQEGFKLGEGTGGGGGYGVVYRSNLAAKVLVSIRHLLQIRRVTGATVYTKFATAHVSPTSVTAQCLIGIPKHSICLWLYKNTKRHFKYFDEIKEQE